MSLKAKFYGTVAVGAVIVFGFMPYIRYGTAETVQATVVDKERVCSSVRDADGKDSVDCKYLIYTDNETFENTDSIWYWKFRSSDVYGKLKEGNTYNFYVYGYRFGWLSWYRNIVSVEQVNNFNTSELGSSTNKPKMCGEITTSDGKSVTGCFIQVPE